MESVTSARNPLLQDVRRAIRKGTLTESGCCVAEGPHLLEEALRSGCAIDAVLTSETARTEAPVSVRTVTLPESLFRSVSSTETSQGIVALVRPRQWSFDCIFAGVPLVLVLDGIQDPGNAGTALRSAEAFGATGVLFLKGSVNPYNPKAVRASAGSLFRVPFLAAVEEEEFLEELRARDVSLYAALPQSSRSVVQCNLKMPAALVVGSEGRGIRRAIQAQATTVTIPTVGVESLNAGVAAAILLYEARRQRMQGITHEPV